MDEVFVARIRLEATSKDLGRMFSVVEEARGRSLLELLVNRPLSTQQKPQELRAGERQIAALQRQLLMTTDRGARLRLLDQIFTAEEQLAPVSTALFDRTRRTGPRRVVPLRDLQRALAPDEVFLEYTLLEPASYVIVATRTSARLQRLPGRAAVRTEVETLLKKVRAGEDVDGDAARLGDMLSWFGAGGEEPPASDREPRRGAPSASIRTAHAWSWASVAGVARRLVRPFRICFPDPPQPNHQHDRSAARTGGKRFTDRHVRAWPRERKARPETCTIWIQRSCDRFPPPTTK